MFVELLVFTITSGLFYLVYNHYNVVNRFRSRGVKCRSGWPLFGNIARSTFQKSHIINDVQEIYRAFPGERYVGYIEGTTPIYLIRDPELIKSITVKDFEHFPNHRPISFDPLFDKTLLCLKGEKWRDMRTTLSPAFTGSKIRAMVPFISDISNNFIQHLKETEGQDIDLGQMIRAYTNDVIASSAFGFEVNSFKEPDNDFYKAGQSLMAISTLKHILMFIKIQFPVLEKILKVRSVFPEKTINFLRNLIIKTMKYREMNQVERADLIQIMLEADKGILKQTPKINDAVGFAATEEHNDISGKVTRKWSEDELVAQAFLFFLAGFESSASVISLMFHELALSEDIQEKLYQEIKEHQEAHKVLAFDHIPDLKYLDCVVNETLRKWSAATVLDRTCIKTYELPPPRDGGKPVKLQPGDLVYNAVNAIQNDEQYFREPTKFIPERFSEDNRHNIKPFTFLPFGSGPRNCIGSRFALLELKIVLYHVILTFKVVKCSRTSEPIRLRAGDFNIRVHGDSWVKVETRE